MGHRQQGVQSVTLTVDGGSAIPLTYGASRPDVCTTWPGYPGCDAIGFSRDLNTNAWSASPCGHVLEIRAQDADGQSRTLDRRRVF